VDAAAIAERRGIEQCVVNISVAEGATEVRRLNDEVSEVRAVQQLPPEAGSSGIFNATSKPEEQGDGQLKFASELMRAPAHALLPTAPVSGAKPLGKSVEYPELTCHSEGNEDWIEVKAATALQFGSWLAGIELKSAAQLQVLVDSAVSRLSSQSMGLGASECGLGRLCMSLLAVLAGGTGGFLLGAHAIHSPLLTVLLDVPWRLVIHSGWPLFGILAQLHLGARQRHTPPTTGSAAEYFRDLVATLERRDARLQADLGAGLERHEGARLAHLGAAFLRSEEGRAHASTYVIPGLCALASQLLSPEVGTESMPIDNALQQVQGFFRQAVQSIEDLQGTLDSAWPLYSVLHLAALQLSDS
jgi:hypothetical protein